MAEEDNNGLVGSSFSLVRYNNPVLIDKKQVFRGFNYLNKQLWEMGILVCVLGCSPQPLARRRRPQPDPTHGEGRFRRGEEAQQRGAGGGRGIGILLLRGGRGCGGRGGQVGDGGDTGAEIYLFFESC